MTEKETKQTSLPTFENEGGGQIEPTLSDEARPITEEEIKGKTYKVLELHQTPRTFDGKDAFLSEFLVEEIEPTKGEKYSLTTWASVLPRQFQEMKDKSKVPFLASIKKEKRYFTFA